VILPLGDAPNPKGVPFLTYTIIAVNCAVYAFITLPMSVVAPDPRDPAFLEYVQTVAPSLPRGMDLRSLLEQTTQYDLFVFQHGYRPAAPEMSSLFASMFLHGGLMHLFGNMLFLWIYGDNVEHRLGRAAYLFWYLLTGAAATLFHAVFDSDSPIPLVGASGAISGVLGFYFLWFPYNRVRLWVFLFPLFMNMFLVPARIVLGMYLFIDNLLPFLVTAGTGQGGVAYGAHIGGFVAGLAAAWVMSRREVATVPPDYREAQIEPVPGTPAQEIAAALEHGRGDQAARWYFALPPEETRRLLDPKTSLELARWLAEHRHAQAALILYQRHLRDYPLGPGRAEAQLGAGLVLLYLLDQPAAAYQRLLEALGHNPDPITAARARQALEDIAARQKLQVAQRLGGGR
jgi:membrane associated rhomboid family serine protease